MFALDALNLSLSVLGFYGLVLSLRYLIPCYIIPFLSARLNETQQLFSHAEAINAIPPESEHRTHLDLYEDLHFDMLKAHTPIQFCEPICGDALADQSSPRALPATAPCDSAWLDLPTLCPLLSNWKHQVESRGKSDYSPCVYSINSSQLAIDNQQLRIADLENATRTVALSTTTPANDVVNPTPTLAE
jgi:hypothetical protein